MKIEYRHNNLWKRLTGRIPAEQRRGLARFVSYAEGVAIERTVPQATGNLAASISSEVKGLKGELKATAGYAGFVHEGTGRYGPEGRDIEIAPVKKKALAFFYKGADRVVKRVRVKGMKPRLYFTEAVEIASRELDGIDIFGETL